MRLEKPSDLLDPDALLKRPGANLMVMAPHPDDESLATGGLIQRALGYGAGVSVVFASDGENNPWPQRVLERREADAALRALGVDADHVHRLGWPDGSFTWMLLDDTAAMLATMRELLVRERPTVLALPDLVDKHPDHSAIHVLMEMVFHLGASLPQNAKMSVMRRSDGRGG